MNRIYDTVVLQEVKFIDKVKNFFNNRVGSETTEKVGWILGAAVVVGIGIAALNAWAPGLFDSITSKVTAAVTGTTIAPQGG